MMRGLTGSLIASAISFSSTATIADTDLILHGGKVFTAVDDASFQQAVAVENGRITAVGSDAEVMELRRPETRLVDLAGKVLMPGLVDSHSHALRGGLQLTRTNLYGEHLPFDELERRLQEGAASGQALQGDVLMVVGLPSAYWDHIEAFEQRFNSGEWAKQPILMVGWDQHTGWANRTMLERTGLADDLPDGFLSEEPLYTAMEALPPTPREQLLTGGRAALDTYHSLGLTAWLDAAANFQMGQPFDSDAEGWLPIYRALGERGELTAHVAALLIAEAPRDLEKLAKVRERFQDVPNLTLPGVKVFADGIAEYPAQTAAMLEPYRNSGEAGELLIAPEALAELVDRTDARGWMVHVHAIGDRATRVALDGVERARNARRSDIPHSITHLQFVNPEDFERFADLDVIASMQLFWASADALSIDMVEPYVSPQAFQYQYPAASLVGHGATLAGGSDWPVTTPNPWEAIYQAMTRLGPQGVLNTKEAVDRDTMFRAYTLGSARLMQLDDRIGSLEPGKQADMIVVDRDVFSITPEQLRDTRVLATYFAGREVFRQSAAPEPTASQ